MRLRKRIGRPRGPQNLVLLTFKADPATVEALAKLRAAAAATAEPGALVIGGKSQVIRAAIQAAAARLEEKGGAA